LEGFIPEKLLLKSDPQVVVGNLSEGTGVVSPEKT
jgi:hypothetical protein